MKSKSYHIYDIENTFNRIIDGKKNPGVQDFITNLDHIRGSKDFRVHVQGIYKLFGTNNFIVTGSTSKYPGYFHVVRNKQGYVNSYTKKSFYGIKTKNRRYSHPGGIQVEDNILVIGNEELNWSKTNTKDNNSVIKFYDISNSNRIYDLNLDIYRVQNNKKASGVGIIRLRNEYIVAVRAKDYLDFYGLPLNLKLNPTYRRINRISLKRKVKEVFNKAQSIQLFKNQNEELYIFAMTTDDVFMFRMPYKSSTFIEEMTYPVFVNKKTFFPYGDAKIRWASCMNFIPVKPSINGGMEGYFEIISTARNVSRPKGYRKNVLIFNTIR